MTADTIGLIMADHPESLSESQLRDLAHSLAGALTGSAGGVYRVRLDTERAAFHDLIQRIYTDDGHGNGRITSDGIHLLMGLSNGTRGTEISPVFALPFVATILANRRDMLAEYDRVLSVQREAVALPLWKQTKSHAALFEGDDITWLYEARYMPTVSRADLNAEKATMRRDAVLTAIALELYRREHRGYPDSLDALVPELLPALPVDRFTGKTLGYAVRDDRPVLYGVGSDYDDDGGVPPQPPTEPVYPPFDEISRYAPPVDRWHPLPSFSDGVEGAAQLEVYLSRYPDGDWILWPPPVEE